MHLKVVNEWLEKLQLKSANLECGAELPNCKDSAHALISAGKKPDKAHHNCSGKHMAMLTIAKHLLPEVQGYSAHSHIVQQVWMHTLSQLIDEDVSTMQWEQDGCGLPAIYMPMQKLASAFALFSEPVKQPGARGMAMNNIVQAIIANPLMIAGSKRCCSAVIEETKGSAIVKAGAEGVYAGVIPQLKIGFALKIDDGATLASEVALGALLKKIGAINQSEENNLSAFFNPSIYNSLGHITGEIRAASAWS
jgi:L-asparaginase II